MARFNFVPHVYLDGSDYRDYSYEDETSMFDPKGRWSPGLDCYMRTYKCRIPKSLGDDEEAIGEWLDDNAGCIKYIE